MDYETLRLIWWALLGILLIGLAIMDGFDLGAAILLPFVAKTDLERRVVINTVGPVWEGNQVWLILGGGAIFAAWPALYAASFSGFYLAMFLVLLALILRPVGFKFRSKLSSPAWRSWWDIALFIGGFVPALVFGVAFGNLFVGVPFGFDSDLRLHETITLFSLLNPFALLAGLVSVAMLVLHGATWLNLKADGKAGARARAVVPYAALLFVVLFTVAGVWVRELDGFRITSVIAPDGPSNPLLKTVARVGGGWWGNYTLHPLFWIAPLVAYLGALIAVLSRRVPLLAWIGSALVPFGVIATAGLSLFPFLLPSSSNPDMSLTVWDASSSKLTLYIMLGCTVIFLPIVLAYTAWAYRILRGPVKAEAIMSDSHSNY
ncbi:MAG: cytochrome d ubiquinol oxidase subunit II [Alphaproteobacteria bacterium]|nr:cytochrome d ubiquinol oxidase subunit II [Alphaproteobacteria bacterium]MDE2112039.1 cytochrome d ubiquinol oxidase subunit II [Alphaproteobacteria bacterium]MDE2492423.1 cytochrome d ubiquinol oxidase subunit II [Alphaproteobacteria bacterium]